MRILNFGSLNIDHVYSVDHFVRPGETLGTAVYQVFPGGKGANQSTAAAYAGAQVAHAGKLGTDGAWYRDRLKECGVDVTFTEVVEGASGHAIIQVNKAGENAILLFGGANQQVTEADAERVIATFGHGDFLLMQNEISATAAITYFNSRDGSGTNRRSMSAGVRTGLPIFGPSPASKARSRSMACGMVRMSENRMAASSGKRSSGCSVTSQAYSGFMHIARKLPAFARVALYSGR